MVQQLLHSYFQKSCKADTQVQKIQYSCTKVSQSSLLTSALGRPLPYSYLYQHTKGNIVRGFLAILILNISSHANVH